MENLDMLSEDHFKGTFVEYVIVTFKNDDVFQEIRLNRKHVSHFIYWA